MNKGGQRLWKFKLFLAAFILSMVLFSNVFADSLYILVKEVQEYLSG